MGITRPRRAQVAVTLAPLLVEENTRRHTAHGVLAAPLALPGLTRAPAEGLQKVCRGFAKGCKLAPQRGAEPGQAVPLHIPSHGRAARLREPGGSRVGAGWEQCQQLQHPPAPSFHRERGNRNAKCHLLLQRWRSLPSCLSSANRE